MYEILKAKSISVVIPAYNEPNLLERIQFIENELNKYMANVEIIAVCDGEGKTPIQKLVDYRKNNVRIYHYSKNQGKGFALKFGAFHATGDYIFFIDGGPELHPVDIKKFMLLMEAYETDIVIGSKRHPLSNTNYPWYRKLLSLGYQVYISLLLGLKFVKDTQVGLKLFKREILKQILPDLKTKGYSFDIELLALAHKIPNIRILEAPVTLISKTKGENLIKELLRLVQMTIEMIIDTLYIAYRVQIKRKFHPTCTKTWGFSEEFLSLKPINQSESVKVNNENTDHRGVRIYRSESLQKIAAEQA